jgi:O-methyltransferase/methyltransferase family protein
VSWWCNRPPILKLTNVKSSHTTGVLTMLEQTSQEIRQPMPPPLVLLEMATGFWVSQAIYVAAKLGIADLLKDGPRTSDDLARATWTHPSSLDRLMSTLASLGVFVVDTHNRFGLTPLGRSLQNGVPGSVRAMTLTLGEEHYHAWGDLLHSVSTGKPAFDHVYKMGLFQYFAQNAAASETFNEGMADVTALVSIAVLMAYDFSGISTIVDVGGGHGALIRTILMANPKLKGILFDAAPAIEEARKRTNGDGLAERCQFVAGDFFQSVPSGSDVCIMKNILHDWDDERCVTILKNCKAALAENGKVLLVETVMPPASAPSFDRLLDLNMLVISGGRERSEAEYRALFDAAGLELTKIVPTVSPLSVIEAVRKSC